MFVETKRDGETITEPKFEPWRDTLRRAADYLDRHGHCKGSMGGHNGGSACLFGAILAVAGEHVLARGPFIYSIAAALQTVVCRDDSGYQSWWAPIESLAAWNDAPERTATEVIAACRAAAEVGLA